MTQRAVAAYDGFGIVQQLDTLWGGGLLSIGDDEGHDLVFEGAKLRKNVRIFFLFQHLYSRKKAYFCRAKNVERFVMIATT